MFSLFARGFKVTAKWIRLPPLILLSSMLPAVQCGGPLGRCIRCLLQLAECMDLQTVPAEAVLALTQVVYGEVLVMILPTKLGIDIWTFVHVAIAGLLAHLAGIIAIRTMEYVLPVNIHSLNCRKWGAIQVFCQSGLKLSLQYQPGLVTTILLPGILACNVQFVYLEWMMWSPVAKRPAGLPQPNSKRPRQQQVDVKNSSLQSIDTTTGNTHYAGVESTASYKKAKHNENHDESCYRLAAKLTCTANREISAVRPKAKGLEFEVSFKFISTTKGDRQSKPLCNFQCEASVAGKVVRTVDVPVRNDKIKGALQSTKALLHFPKAFNTALKAQVLLDVAAESARTAMEKYKGVRIDCEYLGVLADDRIAKQHRKYIANPFLWQELETGDRSSQREV